MIADGHVSGSYTYTEAGVYTLTLTVTDDDGGVGTSIFEYVVVYNPDGGFVSGAGWIESPAGSYMPDPTLMGPARFGFISKYVKGASAPIGQTQFRFKVADLDFHSDSYDWLVIAGKKAMYKGVGTINGEGDYKFMLSAIDGDLQGGDGVDKFRMKIWTEDENGMETVIYDNQLGDADDADADTALGGGNIKIHKAK